MKPKKSFREKLADDKDLPKVVEITGKMARRLGTGTMVIPAPREVDAIMRHVPKGKLITINEIRAILAHKHNTTIGCPITTGIFAWIAAHAADEDVRDGKKRITPYWRTLKSDGALNEKYPGGVDAQKAYLQAEGHHVMQKGKKFVVDNFEKKLLRK
jgi:hypothetical protein